MHVLNGTDNVSITANGSFTLPTAVASSASYSVTVGTPTSAQTCAVQNGSGAVASTNVTNVVVYCTYNVSNATLNNTYTEVAADFDLPYNGSTVTGDNLNTSVYNGTGTVTTTATVNGNGFITTGVDNSGGYAVTTTDAIPVVAINTYLTGGIEGANGDALLSVEMQSGTPSAIGVSVLPNTAATTDSINGNYKQVSITANLTTSAVKATEGTITLTNGAITGTLTYNTGGTITTGNQASGQLTVANGIITVADEGSGAVSADGDLAVVADTTSGDNPQIVVVVSQGTGVTQATVEGVYSVVEYGGTPITSTFGKAITLFAYGNGTYSVGFTKNANGTITTNNTDTGTYTVASDGTLTLTDSEGDVYNGGISADGNALVLGSVASDQNPAIFVGVRQ